MNTAGLVTLLLSALYTLSSGLSKGFHLVNLKKNWTEAQRYCRENFLDLATIENEEELAAVTSMGQRNELAVMWIGLYDRVLSWKWSLDGTSVDFTSWYADNPYNHEERYCVVLLNGLWRTVPCQTNYKSLCYDESTDSYIEIWSLKSWHGAQSYCRATYTDLASMKNQQVKQRLMAMLSPVHWWWIGLSRDSWGWSDQRGVSFTGWAPEMPVNNGNDFCVAHHTDSAGWHDDSCGQSLPFICNAYSALKVVKIELSPGESVDLNDTAWQEAFLKEMEKRLRDKGIHQKLKLSWRKQPDGLIMHKKQEV
ncbi:macrophage mannose receptor 1-like [Polymixia lowei]